MPTEAEHEQEQEQEQQQQQQQQQPSLPPADWKGPQAAWYDLQKARAAKSAAEQALEAERERLAKLESDLTARATTAEQRATELAARYERDTALLGTEGLPATFRHPRMRDRLWQDYQSYRQEAGDNAAPFAEYVISDEIKGDPLYAAHFASPEPDRNAVPALPPTSEEQAQGAQHPGLPPVPAPRGGTGNAQPPQGQPVEYTEEVIARLRAQGLWRVGRINPDGTVTGGSAHFRQWVKQGGR